MKHKEILLKEIRDGISHFNMSDLITIIEYECFENSCIESIKLSKNLKIIEGWAFLRCKKLKDIDLTICKDLVEIGEGAFCDCHSLKRIYIPDKIKLNNCIFWDCYDLVEVRLPNDLEKLGENLLRGCRNLTSINIPSSVVEIEGSVFFFSGIKEVNISKEVKFNPIRNNEVHLKLL